MNVLILQQFSPLSYFRYISDIFQMYLCCLTSIIGAKSKLDLRYFCNAHRTEKHHCLSLNANLTTT